VLLQLRTAFTKLELCHKIKTQARVTVKVPLYGANLVTFVPTMRCYIKVTLEDFICVTSVTFLDKPTGANTVSEIMREARVIWPQHDTRGSAQKQGIMFKQVLLLVKENSWCVLTSCMFSLALLSLGCTIWPVTFRLPWITNASSGRSVLIPTLPAWKIDSGVWPFCQQSSTSLSNWPGFDA